MGRTSRGTSAAEFVIRGKHVIAASKDGEGKRGFRRSGDQIIRIAGGGSWIPAHRLRGDRPRGNDGYGIN